MDRLGTRATALVALALVAACGRSSATADGADARDTADGPADLGDAGGDDADPGTETAQDVDGADAGADAATDTGTDVGAADGADADMDVGADAEIGSDVASDSGADAGPDAGTAERIFGVTVTDPWAVESSGGVLESKLDGLVRAGGRRPTARVVFDEYIDLIFHVDGLDASDYVPLVQDIGLHADVMGELLDSLYVGDYDLDQYRSRACEYRATLGHLVDIWEIGNEVNGEWLGDGVLDKLAAAADVFAADAAGFAALCPGFTLRSDERPFRIALTFYYNGPYDGGVPTADNCWSDASHAMDRWVDDGFATAGAVGTERIAPHLDLVLISYYEDGCGGLEFDWGPIFDHLGTVFPRAALGFGECGTEDAATKVALAERYYRGMDLSDPAYANMHVGNPRYVGGFFWWFFNDDMTDPGFYGALVAALAGPFWSGGP